MYSTLSSPLLNPLLFNFPLRYSAKPYPRITTTTAPFTGNSIFLFKSFSPLHPLRAPAVAVRSSVNDDKVNEIRPVILSDNPKRCGEENNALAIAKPVAYALLCIVFGFCFPFFGFRRPALAAAAAAPPAAASRLVVTEENGHEYSSCTRRLLTVVSKLLKIIEAAKIEGKVDCGPNVEEGLQEVKTTKGALQEEIMNGLYAELRVLNGEKETLMNRSEEIVDKVFKSKREEENLAKKVKGGVAKIERLREGRKSLENEYNEIWGRIGEIEDLIERKETMALSIGVRELLFIERECEALAESFLKEMRRSKTER